MLHAQIIKRQQYWRDHVLAAAAYDGSIAEYAAANNPRTKDLYQWKTALIQRGFLPLVSDESKSDFTEVKLVSTSMAKPALDTLAVQCRLTLSCGSVLEYFNPVDPDTIAQLLAGLRS